MNLNEIAGGVITAVNPLSRASLLRSTGSTTADDGSRVPSYAPAQMVWCQVQSMQGTDLALLDGLGIQGVRRKIYVNAHWQAILREDQRGGDLITFANGDVYLVVTVLEQWPGWTSVAVVLQL